MDTRKYSFKFKHSVGDSMRYTGPERNVYPPECCRLSHDVDHEDLERLLKMADRVEAAKACWAEADALVEMGKAFDLLEPK